MAEAARSLGSDSEHEHITWSPDSRAALLRAADGSIVGTTWGGTICWFPRRPSRFAAIADDGSEHVIRCGFCPGCREFDRRRLAERLRDHYAGYEGELWLVIVSAPLERHAAIAAAVHRSCALGGDSSRGSTPSLVLPRNKARGRKQSVARRERMIERGFYRLGAEQLAFIAKGKPHLARSRILARYQVMRHRIRRSRGLRAFAVVTAGILVPRDDYGEQTNRFYHRGLKKFARDRRWSVSTTRGIQGRRRVGEFGAPRAWRDGITIHPPAVWKLPRLTHRKGPERRRTSRPTEAAAVLDSLLTSFLGGDFRQHPLLSPPPQQTAGAETVTVRAARAEPAPPSSSFSRAGRAGLKDAAAAPFDGAEASPHARAHRARASESGAKAPPLNTGPSLSEGPGYRSSLHSNPPRTTRRGRDPADLSDFWAETLARMHKLADERDRK